MKGKLIWLVSSVPSVARSTQSMSSSRSSSIALNFAFRFPSGAFLLSLSLILLALFSLSTWMTHSESVNSWRRREEEKRPRHKNSQKGQAKASVVVVAAAAGVYTWLQSSRSEDGNVWSTWHLTEQVENVKSTDKKEREREQVKTIVHALCIILERGQVEQFDLQWSDIGRKRKR